jgi:D-alanyl-D-alanine carboxypeptidase/D-alanyl-D-alanine-endopeptidase (penicillin-binding protein 4)
MGLVFGLTLALLSSCATFKSKQLNSQLNKADKLSDHFVGLVIFDPLTNEYLYEKEADKYFTPASNTKLFTFFAGLKLLGDSLDGLRYTIKGDSLIFSGTGDPTLLNPKFPNQPIYDFLASSDKQLYWATGYYDEPYFGPGWSWDDYAYGFQPERSELPIYGNMVRIYQPIGSDSLSTIPKRFNGLVELDNGHRSKVQRDQHYNYFTANPELWIGEEDTLNRPFQYTSELVAQLLSDTLKKQVSIIEKAEFEFDETVKSLPSSLVYEVMLKASDNFLAEQLLINSSSKLSSQLNAANTMVFMKRLHFKHMEQKPIWRDGSGLSRYNLVTPRSIVQLLDMIYEHLPKEELYALLPEGGVSGTLKDWYGGNPPYVYAKTGTLSNNYCLSGYLETTSGRTLLFSFMNNNYPGSSSSIKPQMQQILEWIRDNY